MASTRFKPDPMDYALIEFRPVSSNFQPNCIGLILNESYSGAAIVVNTLEEPLEEQAVKVQVGRVGPIAGVVKWVKVLEGNLLKIGIQFE